MTKSHDKVLVTFSINIHTRGTGGKISGIAITREKKEIDGIMKKIVGVFLGLELRNTCRTVARSHKKGVKTGGIGLGIWDYKAVDPSRKALGSPQ